MANTSKRGFASMDASKQREIASKGGRAAHAKGTAHEFTSDEARVAGRKGGEAVSRDRSHMSAIGREGGHSRGARARAMASGNTGINTPTASDQETRTDQSFARQVTSERSGFEPERASDRVTERPADRSFSPDRNAGANRTEQISDRNLNRNDQGSDRAREDRSPFGGRNEA